MSTATDPGRDIQFIELAVPLLKEYTAKLKELTEEALVLFSKSKESPGRLLTPSGAVHRDEIVRRWKYLKPPAEELARQASAIIEEGRVTSLERVELWLRLSEFEHYLGLAQDYIDRVAAIK
jgi:hypothetical protein